MALGRVLLLLLAHSFGIFNCCLSSSRSHYCTCTFANIIIIITDWLFVTDQFDKIWQNISWWIITNRPRDTSQIWLGLIGLVATKEVSNAARLTRAVSTNQIAWQICVFFLDYSDEPSLSFNIWLSGSWVICPKCLLPFQLDLLLLLPHCN